jgi:hypothetical protein
LWLDDLWEGPNMRTCLLIAGLMWILVLGTGCIIIDADDIQGCQLAAAEPAAATVCATDAGGGQGPVLCHQEW